MSGIFIDSARAPPTIFVDAAGRPTRSDRTSIDLHIAGREDESGGINVAQLVLEKSRLGNVQRYKLARPEMNTVEYRSVRSCLLRATTTRKRSGGNYYDCRAFITQRENGKAASREPGKKGRRCNKQIWDQGFDEHP